MWLRTSLEPTQWARAEEHDANLNFHAFESFEARWQRPLYPASHEVAYDVWESPGYGLLPGL